MQQQKIYQTKETRDTILRVAEALFLERGFFQTQMKDVADATGMSRNTLYRYFHDKGSLAFAILDIAVSRAVTSFQQAIARARESGHANARETLMAAMSDMALGGKHDADLLFMAEFDAYYTGERIPEDFATRQDLSVWTPAGKALQGLVQEGVADGSIRNDIDPALLLRVTLNAIRVMQREVLTRGTALSLPGEQGADQLLPTLIKLLSDGIKPQTRT
jgi:AcrR family transcriptional regulator